MIVRHVRPRAARSRRDARRRGAILVEAAFVFPIMVVCTFAVIELGSAFNTNAAVGSSSRSGVRLASSQYANQSDKTAAANSIAQAVRHDVSSIGSAQPMEMWVYRANSGRPGSCTTTTRCIRFTWNSSTGNWNAPSGSWTDPDGCGETIDRVGVWVQARHPFITRVLGAQKIVQQATVMRLEPLSTDLCT